MDDAERDARIQALDKAVSCSSLNEADDKVVKRAEKFFSFLYPEGKKQAGQDT